eukprot:1800798-Rhodomonas_salina.1
MSKDNGLVSSEEIVVFNGDHSEWDWYSGMAKSQVGPLLFVLNFATLNPVTVRTKALDMYKDWCEDLNEKEFNLIKTTFKEEQIKTYG